MCTNQKSTVYTECHDQLSLFVLVLANTSTVAITAAPAPRKAKAYITHVTKVTMLQLHSYTCTYVLIYYYSKPSVIRPLFISTLRMESEKF